MMNRRGLTAVFLLVAFVGIQFGAGWYEKLSIVPLWADVPPGQALAAMNQSGMYRAGRSFWPFVSPVVAVLALVNVVMAWRSQTANRRWWRAGATLMTAYAVFSYSYFVPQMLVFQAHAATWTDQHIDTFIAWWTGLNYLRMSIGALGWGCALRALSLSAAHRRDDVVT